jgi:predicted deacylase
VTSSPDGSVVSIPVNVIRGLSDGLALLIVAGAHGDEHEGPTSLISLWEGLRPEDLRGTVIMVPVLNAPAFRASRRWSLEDDVDLNRNFPGDPKGTLTHRIARVFCDQILGEADFVLSMHGWTAGYLVEPYVEFPGSAATGPAAYAAARAFGLGLLNPLDAGPGRLMTVASDRGIPLIEVEIGGQSSTLGDRRRLYEVGTRNLLVHLDQIDGEREEPPAPVHVGRNERVAPAGGLLRPVVAVGDQVAEGQTLATLHDLNLRLLARATSPATGVVGVLRLCASTLAGQLVATVFSPSDWTPPAPGTEPR